MVTKRRGAWTGSDRRPMVTVGEVMGILTCRALPMVVLGLTASTFVPAEPVLSQSMHLAGSQTGDALLPDWMAAWSPLVPLADLPRLPPGSRTPHPMVSGLSSPGLGLFWSAGNPGGLPFDVVDSEAVFATGMDERSGGYHRPLDPGREKRTRAEAVGWRSIDRGGAIIGRASGTSSDLTDGVHSGVLRPYSSSPYMVADTSGTDLTRLSSRVEGAGGWMLRGFGLGLTFGYEAQETQTIAAPVPRRSHSAGSAARLGVARAFREEALLLGVHGGWQRYAETTRAFTIAAPTRVYEFDGYDEVRAQNISALYHRRLERDALVAGVSAAGRIGEADWVLWLERATADEEQYNERTSRPNIDFWSATSTTVGAGVRRTLSGHARITAHFGWTSLEGEAHPYGGPGEPGDGDDPPSAPESVPAFRADESAITLSTELRVPLPERSWELRGHLHLSQEERTRRDLRIATGSVLELRSYSVGLDVLRTIRSDLTLSAGGAMGSFSPSGSIPPPDSMGPVYQRWLAPELSMMSTPAGFTGLTLGVRWEAGSHTTLWAHARHDTLRPDSTPAALAGVPGGDRGGWTLTVGASLHE